uniref:Uncharacterized protein n=1 Tax=Arundo donax TaxID=35708 RepID=A0A0A8Z7C5_ARUDO
MVHLHSCMHTAPVIGHDMTQHSSFFKYPK